MLTLSKNHNINYAAKIVRINNIRRHSNADRLQCTSIAGNNVIIGNDQKVGDLGIYFPVESQIATAFLKENNLFKEKEANKNNAAAGFFEQNGRVKALKLRGEKSEGFWIPIDALNCKPFLINHDTAILHEGADFDAVGGELLVKKYRIKYSNSKDPSSIQKKKSAKQESIIVENQFHFHIDTPQLGRNLFKFNSKSNVSITQKLHGTSFISSKVLTKKKLTWKDRLARWFGCNVIDTHYGNLYASRRVIKNIGSNKGSYYSEDIWGMANTQIEPHLKDGMTVYGEVVGFLPSGKMIQKDFDYGCLPMTHKVFVYRITWTLPNGHVIDWSWGQIKEWCRFHGLQHVPEFYAGKALDFVLQYHKVQLDPNDNIVDYMKSQRNPQIFDNIDDRDWNDLFINTLKEQFLEKKADGAAMLHGSIKCNNPVWDEGVVVRLDDSFDFDVYKLKSFNFLAAESLQLDRGDIDIESIESDVDVDESSINESVSVAA
jgi:hypothetical protein